MLYGVALSAVAAGIVALRVGWRRARRLVTGGWAAIIAGTATLGVQSGAWGVAVAGLIAMSAALLIVLRDGWMTPAGRRVPARDVPSVTPPRWRVAGLARRVAVFALVVPAGLAASEWLALGAEAAARRAGWREADTIVLALITQPTAWAVVAGVQLLGAGPRAMVAPVVACLMLGGLLWWL